MIAGYAQKEFLTPLVERSGIADVFQPLYVRNDFFGGNVDVTGLLVGRDMTNAIKLNADTTATSSDKLYLIPRVVFNDDGITLDDMTLEDMEKAAGQTLHMVSCSPKDYLNEIIELLTD